jgi:long-chain acyl-CoA synthetase
MILSMTAAVPSMGRRRPSSIRRFLRTAISTNAADDHAARGAQPSMAAFNFNFKSYTTPSLVDKNNTYLRFNTLHELVNNATLAYGSNPLFGTFVGSTKPTINQGEQQLRNDNHNDNAFQWLTYAEFGKNVALCRIVLKQLGVGPHSKVGIISNNRQEWPIVAAAAYSLNAALVPMYEQQLPKDWCHILNDSECSVLFCSTEDIFLKAKREVLPSTPLVREVLCFDAPASEPHSFAGAMTNAVQDIVGINSGVVEPSEEDLANLIYTR